VSFWFKIFRRDYGTGLGMGDRIFEKNDQVLKRIGIYPAKSHPVSSPSSAKTKT
jgi:hypothetical protein